MNISDFRVLVEQRRSIRGYDENREVSEELITTILDCARWAPSGGNGQPWEFVVVRNKQTRHKIADYYLKQMEQKREMDLAVRGTAKMTGDGFRRAPVHIVIVGDPRVKESYPIRTKLEKAESHFITGLANATLLIHLAATSLGLASQYVSDANWKRCLRFFWKFPNRCGFIISCRSAMRNRRSPPRRGEAWRRSYTTKNMI